MKQLLIIQFSILILLGSCTQHEETLFYDDFTSTKQGPYSVAVGAHTEYHYLHEAAPRGKWEVSTFRYDKESMINWSVVSDENGGHRMVTNYPNTKWKHSHPMLCAGEMLWKDYSLSVNLSLVSDELMTGVIIRYQNDRCYYVFCLNKGMAQIKYVNHATGFREPLEEILVEKPYTLNLNKPTTLEFSAQGEELIAKIGELTISAKDNRYSFGKIALVSDALVKYNWVKVTATPKEKNEIDNRKNEYNLDVENARKGVPAMKLYKKFSTIGFGVGRNLRFGDLDGDGDIDVLIPQVKHHGPSDANSEVGCITAMTLEGEMLWRIGKPDNNNQELSNDVGIQIHDINNDGKNEVIYCKDLEIVVAEGATGKTLYKKPTPKISDNKSDGKHNIFERVLGDCLFFLDLEGKGYNSNIIIKDRYKRVWALNQNLEVLWYKYLNTGHFPYAYDVDEDGKDELLIGYTLLDDDGSTIWTLENELTDHADGVALINYFPGEDPIFMCAASDEGIFYTDKNGKKLAHHYLGHVQNPVAANFRDDMPGLETVAINFWGNQGIITFLDAKTKVYNSIEPNQYGSMCLPLNWTGKSEEFFVLNPNVDEGGVYDGWGRNVLDFPGDGHPDMCNATLDITGDCRDEIVVWDHNSVWVYTQEDSPKAGKLYKPIRNSLSNYSNYQASVSYPNWSE